MVVRVVSECGVSKIEVEKAQSEQVGQKGLGLLSIPSPWSLPFLAVDASVFQIYATEASPQKKIYFIQNISENINRELEAIDVLPSDKVIVRSSGVNEGITERGLYDSQTCTADQIGDILKQLFDDLLGQYEAVPKVAYIIQKYIEGGTVGHLSNERRFSRVKRDWVYEYSQAEAANVVSGKIRIRRWRKEFSVTGNRMLCCDRIQDIEKVLREVAEYYTVQKKTMHFEFLWDGIHIFLLQADRDDEKDASGEDPTSIDVSVNGAESLADLEVLRLVSDTDRRFSKVENTLIYSQVGLKTVPLYILSDKEVFKQLKEKRLPRELAPDLKKLSRFSIVIRSDVYTDDQGKKTMLKRSNELRSFDAIVEWLFAQQGLYDLAEDIALLFHVFIPARCSAFVKASPTGRIVEIEALWGLPEGLYYNAHDKVAVDTKLIEADLLTPEVAEIKKVKQVYKGVYIAPDVNGAWVAKQTRQPYDWRLCIDERSIRQIAIESRKIASYVQKQISVMWFIGIDEKYYGTANLAWYHEPYTDKAYTDLNYKKKYFYEDVMVIKDETDYQMFVENKDIRQVQICPVKDSLLRDRRFLEKIGNTARERKATIILEGTVLAHPLYQLCRTGANVIIPNSNDDLGEEENYNKLVRDRIPEIIQNNGEEVTCRILEKNAFLRALLEKAVEEAYEIANAPTAETLKEELCDEFEVLCSINCLLNDGAKADWTQHKILRNRTIPLSHMQLEKTMRFCLWGGTRCRVYNSRRLGTIICAVSHDSTQLQVELHFSHGSLSFPPIEQLETGCLDRTLSRRIICCAYSLTSTTSSKHLVEYVNMLQNLITSARQQLNWDESDFLEKGNKKRDKRGGFTKGYMLKSTKISFIEDDEYEQEMLELPASGYKIISAMKYQPIKNIDFLDRGKGELLVRISIPVCFNEYQMMVDSAAAQRFLGRGNELALMLKRTKSKLTIEAFFNKQEEYDQLCFS